MVHLVRSIVRLWKDSFASVLVRDIRPSHLKALQKRMVTEGQSRGYVNKVTSCSKSMFRWAVENDLAPAEVWQGLLAVRGLAKGRTEARETEPIGPVEDSVVDACLPCMPDGRGQIWCDSSGSPGCGRERRAASGRWTLTEQKRSGCTVLSRTRLSTTAGAVSSPLAHGRKRSCAPTCYGRQTRIASRRSETTVQLGDDR